uniref:Uncharacterized protein n=1 Tax=Rhodnius prolixus TaxID=13249 RepID=A0A0G2KBG5_RHOPR
MKSRNEFGE